MSNVFTLDSLREEVEKEFAPVKIGLDDGTEVVLQNVLRLGKKDREKAIGLLEGLDKIEEPKEGEEATKDSEADIEEMLETVHQLLVLVAKANGAKLVAQLGDDVPLTMTVVNKWMEATSPGEAQPSQD